MKAKTAIVTHYGTGGSLLYLQQLACALENNSSCRYVLKEPSENAAFFKPKFLKYLYHLSKYLYNAMIFRPEGSLKVAHLLSLFYLTDLLILQTYRKALEK